MDVLGLVSNCDTVVAVDNVVVLEKHVRDASGRETFIWTGKLRHRATLNGSKLRTIAALSDGVTRPLRMDIRRKGRSTYVLKGNAFCRAWNAVR